MDPLSLALIAIAEGSKATAAIFTYLSEHERGLTPAQREAYNQIALSNLQWQTDQAKAFIDLLGKLKLPGS